mmetsp:Transcript_55778/g.121514  ORF Transcript_55778/g.121514 Transcript_55778/m.121514 type:complete len:108 (+) Transcript_55778:3-326(+)
MRNWIDAKTRLKIQFLAGQDQWAPMAEVLDLRLLPLRCGGEAELGADGLCPSTLASAAAMSPRGARTPLLDAFKKTPRPSSSAGRLLYAALVALLAILVALQLQTSL